LHQINIRKAEQSDVERVYELATEYLLAQRQQAPKGGFLVSSYSKEDYLGYIDKAGYFFVAEDDGEIIAFILAYSSNAITDDALTQLTDRHVGRGFVLIKQICVDPSHTKRGVGRKLYTFIAKQTAPLPLLAAIVLDPENRASVRFHNKLGFSKILEFIPTDGMLRGMWAKGV
jgi:predicted GNAT superfamily acetyltransferase